MNKNFCRLCAFAIVAALQMGQPGVACAQGTPPAGAGGGMGQAAAPTSPTEATPGTDLPVLYVTSVEVLRTAMEPKLDIVRVDGFDRIAGLERPAAGPDIHRKALGRHPRSAIHREHARPNAIGGRFCSYQRRFPIGGGTPLQGGTEYVPQRMQSRSSSSPASTRCRSPSMTVRIVSARNSRSVARRSPANRVLSVRRISPRCCAGSSRRAASGASRTILIDST